MTLDPTFALGTDYFILKDSYPGSFNEDASQVTVIYRTSWDNYNDPTTNFIDYLLGWGAWDASGDFIVRELPDELDGYPSFFCTSAQAEGLGANTTSPDHKFTYTDCRIVATYRPVDYYVLPDADVSGETIPELLRFCSRSYEPKFEFQTHQGKMKFVTSGAVLDFAPMKPICMIEKTIHWCNVPSNNIYPDRPPNWGGIQACVGRLNLTEFDDDPMGTVLCLPPTVERVKPRLKDELPHWNISLKFSIVNNGDLGSGFFAGQNYVFNIQTGEYELVTHDGTALGNTMYQSEDFGLLFRADV